MNQLKCSLLLFIAIWLAHWPAYAEGTGGGGYFNGIFTPNISIGIGFGIATLLTMCVTQLISLLDEPSGDNTNLRDFLFFLGLIVALSLIPKAYNLLRGSGTQGFIISCFFFILLALTCLLYYVQVRKQSNHS